MEDRYLYRAKRKDNGEWVQGYYVKGLDMYDKEIHLIFEPATSFYSNGETAGWHEIDPSTICKCTGLKDKNGKMIWENDIITCICGAAKVVWDMSQWRMKFLTYCIWRRDLYFWVSGYSVEVIGNIFDNPELLESEE